MLIAHRNAMAVHKPLPYDAEVEYLASTWWQGRATEYIDTGYALTTDVWEIDAVFDCPGTKWGAQTSNDRNWMANQWSDKWWFGTSLGQFSRSGNIGGKGRYLWRGSNGVVEGSVEGVSFSGTYTGSVVSGCSCFLFACNQGGSAVRQTIGKVYSFKLSDNGKTVRDMIPVRFTNELGESEGAMYDRVSGQLFRNAGTGVFVFPTA